VNRLVNVICRAARMIGETSVFENNGPALWGRITRALETLMSNAWTLGALDGASASDAFSVRCDRSTMTQNDLDNGRLVALVTFTAAAIVETITVTLSMETTGTSAQAIAASVATSNLASPAMAGVS
jgi:phage tail sheath protein FI